MKKSNTESADGRLPELARLISGVLKHPDTPEAIRNGILEGMATYQYDDTDESRVLLVLEGAKAKGKGGAS